VQSTFKWRLHFNKLSLLFLDKDDNGNTPLGCGAFDFGFDAAFLGRVSWLIGDRLT
jgi:hypothetical protein